MPPITGDQIGQAMERALATPRLRADQLPGPLVARPRVEATGVDPDSAGAVMRTLFARGLTFWLNGALGPPWRFSAVVLEMRHGAGWADGRGDTAAAALGSVLVQWLPEPPWESTAGDAGLDNVGGWVPAASRGGVDAQVAAVVAADDGGGLGLRRAQPFLPELADVEWHPAQHLAPCRPRRKRRDEGTQARLLAAETDAATG